MVLSGSGSYTSIRFRQEPVLTLPPATQFVLTEVRTKAAERNPELIELRLDFASEHDDLTGAPLVGATCAAAANRRYGPALQVEVNVYGLGNQADNKPVDTFVVAIGRPSSQAGLRDDDAPAGPRLYRQAPWELPNQARVDELSLVYPDLDGERDNIKVPGVIPQWARTEAFEEGLRVRVVSFGLFCHAERDYALDGVPTCSALAEMELHRALTHCGVCPKCVDAGDTQPPAIHSAVFDGANRIEAVGTCDCGETLAFRAAISLSGSKPPLDYWNAGWRPLGTSSSQSLWRLGDVLRRSADTPFRSTSGEPTPEGFIYEALCDLIDGPTGCDEATFARVLQSIWENRNKLGTWATYLATLKRGDYVRSFPGRGRARAYNSRAFLTPSQLQELLKLAHDAIRTQHPEWYHAADESPSDEAVVGYLLDTVTRYPGIRALARPHHDASQCPADWYVLQQVGPPEFMLLEDLAQHLAPVSGTAGNWGLAPGDLSEFSGKDYPDATRLGRLRIAADKVKAVALAEPNHFLTQLTIQLGQKKFAQREGQLPKASLKIQRELLMAGTPEQRAQLEFKYIEKPQFYPRNWGTHLTRELRHLAQLTDPETLGGWPDPETPPEYWRLFVVEETLSPADAARATDDRVYRYLAVNPKGEMHLSRRYWLAAHQPDFGLMNEVEGANELRERSGAYRSEQDDDALRFELSRIYGNQNESEPSLRRGELHDDHLLVIS